MRNSILNRKDIFRSYLQDGSNILLYDISSDHQRLFSIDKWISDGASFIAYEAHYDNSSKGVLKEFYPHARSSRGIIRDEDGHVLIPPKIRESFLSSADEQIKIYNSLHTIKITHEELNCFLPHFEIFKGVHDLQCGRGTYYIWTPYPPLASFAELCSDYDGSQDTVKHVYFVIQAIISLTECIRLLHSSNIIHRDLKPTNFGFMKRDDIFLVNSPFLFDIDSFTLVFDHKRDCVGTVGFVGPEAFYSLPSSQTDIYSIGAILLNALTFNEISNYSSACSRRVPMHANFYNEIDDLIEHSSVIARLRQDAYYQNISDFIDNLIYVLEHCLCGRIYRYNNCEELLDDLHVLLKTIPSNDEPDINIEKHETPTLKKHIVDLPYNYDHYSIIYDMLMDASNYNKDKYNVVHFLEDISISLKGFDNNILKKIFGNKLNNHKKNMLEPIINLSWGMCEESLGQILSKYGMIKKISIPMSSNEKGALKAIIYSTDNGMCLVSAYFIDDAMNKISFDISYNLYEDNKINFAKISEQYFGNTIELIDRVIDKIWDIFGAIVILSIDTDEYRKTQREVLQISCRRDVGTNNRGVSFSSIRGIDIQFGMSKNSVVNLIRQYGFDYCDDEIPIVIDLSTYFSSDSNVEHALYTNRDESEFIGLVFKDSLLVQYLEIFFDASSGSNCLPQTVLVNIIEEYGLPVKEVDHYPIDETILAVWNCDGYDLTYIAYYDSDFEICPQIVQWSLRDL